MKPVWRNPQTVGHTSQGPLVVDLGPGLSPGALVCVTLTTNYTVAYPPGYPRREDKWALPGATAPSGTVIHLVKPEADALVAAGWAVYEGQEVPMSGRTLITSDAAYYVTVGGNDTSGDGSQAKPWLTIQTAFNYFMSVDFNGHTLTLNVGPGTFLGGYCSYLVGGGYLTIFGDSSATTTITTPSTYSPCFSFNSTGFVQISFGNMNITAGRYGALDASDGFINLNYYYVVDGNYFTSDLIFSTVNQPYTLMRFTRCIVFTQGTIAIQQHGGSLTEIINLSQSTFDDFSYSDPWVLSGTPDTVSQFVTMARFSYLDLSYTAGFTGSQFIGRKFFIDHNSIIYSGHYNFNVLPGTLPGLWNSSCFYDRLPGPISADNGVGTSSTGSFLPTLSHARYVLNKLNGGGADFIGATNGSTRWVEVFGNATSETGSNVGSDLDVVPYDDTGVALPVALHIARATGQIALNVANMPTAANDAAAATAGVPVGGMYRSGSQLMIRVA